MNEYYEPTLLFRQNAIRRHEPLTPTSMSDGSSRSSHDLFFKTNHSKWMMQMNNQKDIEVIKKSCFSNVLNVKSMYWKVPDNDMNLTSMAVNKNARDEPLLAIASANKASNLYMYDLDLLGNTLTHKTTISLPNIHAMSWVPDHSNLLVTGNIKGYAHLVSIPEDETDESAEIHKRFNHRKHLKSINKSASMAEHQNTSISKIKFLNDNLLSIYDNNIFKWDLKDCESQARPVPSAISSIPGLSNFDTIPQNSNVLGICGAFGVSLFDFREANFNVPSAMIKEAAYKKLGSNVLRWSTSNDNVFAASHRDGIIRLWDIRKQDNFAALNGHRGTINNIEWSGDDLFSGGEDGNIVHWDFSSAPDSSFVNCTLKEGITSINFNPQRNCLESRSEKHECGTILPASNTNITRMCSVEDANDDAKILSIDSSSYFGVHSSVLRNRNSASNNDNSIYYSEEQLREIQLEYKPFSIPQVPIAPEEHTLPLNINRKSSVIEKDDSSSISQSSIDSDEASIESYADTISSYATSKHSISIDHDAKIGTPRSTSLNEHSTSQDAFHPTDASVDSNDEDFKFTSPTFNLKSPFNSMGSDASLSATSSREFEDSLFIDSMASLSTNPTVLDSPASIRKAGRRESSHSYLDLDIETDDFNFDTNMWDS